MPDRANLFAGTRPAPVRSALARRCAPAALLLPLAILMTLLPPTGSAAAAPAGFEDAVVADVPLPTALTFTPDGRMLVTTKPGVLRVVRGDALLPAPALNISAKVCGNYERGLLGVAVDPDFATNGYVFLYYTFKKYGDCGRDTDRVPVNRVSRFVMRGDTIDPNTENILIDNVVSRHGNHNAGDLEFGRDGFLYVSIGDSGCDLSAGDRCGPDSRNARHPELLLGKIARITRDGGIPRTNPYTDPDTSARCALTGRTTRDKQCQETFASGLRNPFRLAFDPNAAGTRFFINDVGQYTREEIDEGRKGVDYGWNVREGFCATGTNNCSTAPTVNGYTSPIHDYPHASDCSSITGGAFVPDGVWPAEYDGNYLFADYVCGGIYRLLPDGEGGFRTPDNPVGVPFVKPNDGSPVHLRFGPHGTTQSLYYTTFAGGGQIRRIAHTADANRAPVARASATPTEGTTPLIVNFDASQSTDPDEADRANLTYRWEFGDGARGDAVSPSHTYQEPGQYTATLIVSDPGGRSDRATIDIDAGYQLPRAVIDAPLPTDRFAVGNRIRLVGHAEDATGTPLPNATLAWEVLLHHNSHAHPFLEETGTEVTFDAPFPEDLDAAKNSYLEIRLTAVADEKTSRTVSRDLNPNKVELTFRSTPPGLTLRVNGNEVVDGAAVTAWAGWRLRVEAPTQRDASGQDYAWASWSDGESTAARVLETPTTPTTYGATFQPVTRVTASADGRVFQARPGASDGGGRTLSAVGGRDTRIESYLRFDVPTGPDPIRRATLRLWVPDAPGAGTANGPAVVRAANRWSERTLSWDNRPAKVGAAVDDAGQIDRGAWVEFDVTRVVTGGPVTFALVSSSRDAVTFSSREGARPPELVIVTSEGAVTATAASAAESTVTAATAQATDRRERPAQRGGQGDRGGQVRSPRQDQERANWVGDQEP
ncbi:MAG: PQQ-dependent sugar dehydrogenase [Chloroflexota bacterium]|nr:PQQ-dependent sugar dehydrogenase [Chloroflexota bacterium]